MTDEWLEAMDRGDLAGVIFIDVRKTFDVVHHETLLQKLCAYGFSPSAITLFTSFF